MPTRIVREGIISSEPVNRLSPSGEIFYRRLMSIADDYGRYYAHPSLLRGACYPLQLERVSDKDVARALAECVREKLIFIYGCGKYIQVAKFNQQCRSKSKFPQPTDNELLINCEPIVNQLQTHSYNDRLGSTTTPNTTTPSTPNANGFNFSFPENLSVESFQKAWSDWTRHLKEKRCKTTILAFEKQISKCADWGVERAIAAINFSIEHNWQGIYEDRTHSSRSNRPRTDGNQGTLNDTNKTDYSSENLRRLGKIV